MRRLVWTGAVLVAMAIGARAQDDYEIKVYPAPRAAGSVVVDGELSESSWQAAPVVSGFTLYDRPELAAPQTHVRVLFDEVSLYVGVLCDEPRMDLLAPVPVARDSPEVFHGDAVEIFLDPRHSHRRYYQFGISAAGSVYDSRLKDRVWSAATRAATARRDSSWSMEVAIPWADLGVAPVPGTLLGFNVCRDRQADRPQWSNWARTKADFHDPVRFGHLVLAPAPGWIDGMGAELRRGDRRGPIAVYTAAGTSAATYEELAAKALAGLRRTAAALEVQAAAESSPVARQALVERVADCRRRLRPFEAQVVAPESLDASTWTRMALALQELSEEMDKALWEARLRAVLARI